MDIGTYLMFSVTAGAIGVGYFVYGKRQEKFIPMIAGAALCFYPYLVSSLYPMIGIGILLVAMPFILKF